MFDCIIGVMSIIMLLHYVKTYVTEDYFNEPIIFYISIFLLALIVHVLKAVRVFIVLFGESFDKKRFTFCYIKTAIVNLLLPFKSGELYRGYSVGKLVGSYSTGYIMVLLDRFVDTLALICIIIVAGLIEGFSITTLYLCLAAFLLFAILVYWIFKPLYQYWNHFLVFRKSSNHTLWGLKFLQLCKQIYENVQSVVRGRFAIVFALSLAAWCAEVLGMMSLAEYTDSFGMATYLEDIMSGELSVLSTSFVLMSIILFGIVGVFLGAKHSAKMRER